MKKKIIALLLGASMVCSLTACGKGNAENTETADSGTEGSMKTTKAERTALPEVASVDMDIDPEKQVTSLCDYSAVPLTITGTYELSQEEIDKIIIADLTGYGLGYVEVTDRDTIEEGDVVKVDYTGYLDGEAFENGSATDQMVTISDDSGYIDGFVDGLVGAKVGETISNQVTFPDPYANNPDLAGKETTFKFKIHGIYRAGTMEEIKAIVADEDVEEIFGSYDISTLQDLIDYETEYMTSLMESNKYSATITALKEYMSENCTVEIPEDYLDARLTEYIISFETDNLDDDESLETHLTENYGVTLEEAMETWKSQEEEQIKSELIFGAVAAKEGITLDEDEFNTFISGILTSSSASSYGFKEEEDIYEYYGAGIAENGKKYMKNLFLMNKAIDHVYENAKVTVQAPAEESTEE